MRSMVSTGATLPPFTVILGLDPRTPGRSATPEGPRVVPGDDRTPLDRCANVTNTGAPR